MRFAARPRPERAVEAVGDGEGPCRVRSDRPRSWCNADAERGEPGEVDACGEQREVLFHALTPARKPLTGSLIAGVGAGGQSVAHVRISSRRPSREARAA